jgi:hypothetical protein
MHKVLTDFQSLFVCDSECGASTTVYKAFPEGWSIKTHNVILDCTCAKRPLNSLLPVCLRCNGSKQVFVPVFHFFCPACTEAMEKYQ